MLSVVPLINGGGLFETGAGGSAPKHVQQLVKENYLRWDSLGEFLALARQLRAPGRRHRQRRARRSSADTLDRATGTFLDEDKSPEPQARHASTTAAATSTWPCTGRRSWPRRPTTPSSPRRSRALAETLAEQETTIVDELIAVQGSPADIGGYYRPDADKADGRDAPVDDLQRGDRRALSATPTAGTGGCEQLQRRPSRRGGEH